jgi:hypothetical protein
VSGTRIVVSAPLANKPGNGGEAWVVRSWVRGFERLGFDTWFVEQLHPRVDPHAAVAWFRECTAAWGMAERSVLMIDGHPQLGALRRVVAQLAEDTAVLVDISGTLRRPDLVGRFARRAYVDLDPGYTQTWWHDEPRVAPAVPHHLHFTIGEHLGTDRCPVPTAGRPWLACRQPVVLDDWPVAPLDPNAAFTTVSTWRAPFGAPTVDGVAHESKHQVMRRLADLPMRTGVSFELATSMHEADHADRDRLSGGGWRVHDAADVVGTPGAFADFVRASLGECSAVQGVYTASTGWCSDRSLRYLASGRPVVVQDTGCDWADDAGYVTFRDTADAADAAAAVRRVLDEPEAHAQAARDLVVEHFDSDRVLSRFIDMCGVAA